MTWVSRQILRSYAGWDRLTKIGFWIAAVLLIVGLVFLLFAPMEQRGWVFVGLIALVIVMQLIVLWGNRGMVTVFTQAQRLYLTGDLDGARDLLEDARSNGAPDFRALTLLGNTYRQFGQLDESRRVLYEALDKAPDHHFPLYNLGRTEAAAGDYTRAAVLYEQALAAGAPAIIRFDLAEACFLNGDIARASTALDHVLPSLNEPHRLMMAMWWRAQMGTGALPPAELIRDGLPYWVAVAERFQDTPYGKAIADTLLSLQSDMKGDARPNV